ncbi:MAG: hypothetical protein P8L37_02400 [Phycisphaerales bacterium]|nr:hypothetical protein [Phycisphaerales bacterium]
MILLALLMMASNAYGQNTPTAPPPTHPLDRIAVIGASVSWGYGTHVPLQRERYTHRELVNLADVLEATLVDEYDLAHHQADLLFFRSPMTSGPMLAQGAHAAAPTIVIGLDYLFWYGYGHAGVEGEKHTGTDSRLALLEEGLATLEAFNCPVVISDFPDMSPAIGRVLRASQVPSPETLTALNERLHVWATEHDNIIVIPLAALTSRLQRNEGFDIEEINYPAGSTSALLQADALHPTTEGDIALVQMILRGIDNTTEQVGEDDYHRDIELIRSRLEATAREQATPPPSPQPAGED